MSLPVHLSEQTKLVFYLPSSTICKNLINSPWFLANPQNTSSWLSAFSSSWDCTSSFFFCVLSAHVENVVSWLVSMKNPHTALTGWVFRKFSCIISPLCLLSFPFFWFYLTSSLIYPKSFIFFFLLVCRANQFTQAPVCKPVHTNSTFLLSGWERFYLPIRFILHGSQLES